MRNFSVDAQLKPYLDEYLQTQQAVPDAILCSTCRHPITDLSQRIEIQGAHQHRYANPAGITFKLACFRQASGCQPHGVATLEYTWFAGYSWRFALCSQCHSHLGWFYQSHTASFYGLIIEQLIYPAK